MNHSCVDRGKEDTVMYFQTACGGRIMITAKAREHLDAHPTVHDLLPEAIGSIVLPHDSSFLSTEVEMERIVGRSGAVKTAPIQPTDQALFALRTGRALPSRVIIGAGEESTKVTVLAFADRWEAGAYVLVTAWIGGLATKEPWDPSIGSDDERQDCLQFWCSHALAHDATIMEAPFESSWDEVLTRAKAT